MMSAQARIISLVADRVIDVDEAVRLLSAVGKGRRKVTGIPGHASVRDFSEQFLETYGVTGRFSPGAGMNVVR